MSCLKKLLRQRREARTLERLRIKYPPVDPSLYAINGCIRLVGQIVKSAIQDAANSGESNTSRSGTRGFYKRDGMNFLFDGRNLEEFFEKYGLENFVNCAMIRSQAQDVIDGRAELTEMIELTETTETENKDD